MDKNLLKSLGMSDSDMLHRAIGTTFIVEYGIIKDIPATGIVTVEMAVADSAEDIIITNCVLASFSSSSVTVNIKPNIDDKVIVLFPRRFAGNMFNPETNEPIITACGNGYTIMGGIAILLNQYQESFHKNYIDISDGCITLKMAYSEDDDKNLFTFVSNADGELTLVSNNVQVTANKDSEITVTNGKAKITVDKNGNVTIDAQGKYTVKNGTTDLKQVIDGLATELENLTTSGSQTAQATSPASKGTIAVWRKSKLNQLF
jgi:hypothetical protein